LVYGYRPPINRYIYRDTRCVAVPMLRRWSLNMYGFRSLLLLQAARYKNFLYMYDKVFAYLL